MATCSDFPIHPDFPSKNVSPLFKIPYMSWIMGRHLLIFCLYYLYPRASIGIILGSVLSLCIRLFAGHAGGHRFFAHRSYDCAPWLKQCMAYIIMSSEMMTIFYWMYEHNDHHKACDTKEDAHSPHHMNFWEVQFGPFSMDLMNILEKARNSQYKHFQGYGADLSWVTPQKNKYIYFSETAFWFILSPLLGYGPFELWYWFALLPRIFAKHGQAITNSVCHVIGDIPYPYLKPFTACMATNCWWAALLNGGEGWHNNHHAYPLSTRHGFLWWEIDTVWYTLYTLALFGQVWDMRVVSQSIIEWPRYVNSETPRPRYDTLFASKKMS